MYRPIKRLALPVEWTATLWCCALVLKKEDGVEITQQKVQSLPLISDVAAVAYGSVGPAFQTLWRKGA